MIVKIRANRSLREGVIDAKIVACSARTGSWVDDRGDSTPVCDMGAFEAESDYSQIYLPLVVK